ncbi:50S ribosomal protein L1 [Cerasicoccus arenae]|uniref:Large ribosomal subunit protein uL1 n=1 Tax=Cerasicoccus arenae TaxID=424488 RepID=A0A8J3DDN7_9BACT|nr:50S ribosomal protein L1 [Cerasicoccus arenae]MBK1859468.1 50S ribosomal protein L1 [Cerasicoccus arenae]GHC10983.1 50S ribosomal protein L1 [Cerasicoccus arenae]
MSKLSKRMAKANESLDLNKAYTLDEAVDTLKLFPTAKFDETIEVYAHLGVDPRQTTQMVRGTVALPHGSGKQVVVLVFTENPEEALAAGAEFAGLDDLIEKVLGGWMDFDVAIATPGAMKEVRKVARVLGPRGMMPNPKAGTVGEDIAKIVNEVKAGRVEFKMDKTANVAVVVGKRSFSKEQILENAQTAIDSLAKSRPDTFKGGAFLKSLTISSTMSPGVKIDVKALQLN